MTDTFEPTSELDARIIADLEQKLSEKSAEIKYLLHKVKSLERKNNNFQHQLKLCSQPQADLVKTINLLIEDRAKMANKFLILANKTIDEFRQYVGKHY